MLAVDLDTLAVRTVLPRQYTHQCAFSCATGSDKRDPISPAKRDGDPLQACARGAHFACTSRGGLREPGGGMVVIQTAHLDTPPVVRNWRTGVGLIGSTPDRFRTGKIGTGSRDGLELVGQRKDNSPCLLRILVHQKYATDQDGPVTFA